MNDINQEAAQIILAGKAYTMQASFHSLSQIEKTLSTSIVTLARKLIEETITLEEMTIIIAYSIREPLSLSAIGEALVEELAQAINAIASMLGQVLGNEAIPAIARSELNSMIERFPD